MSENLILAFLVFYPFLGGVLTWLIGRQGKGDRKKELRLGGFAADFFVVTEFAVMLYLVVRYAGAAADGAVLEITIGEICGFGLNFTLDGFRLVYGMVASLMWMMTCILSRQYFAGHPNTPRFYLFLLLTLGATMGVFLSADLYTTFIFFEIMSFTSYVWVAQEENRPALRAADTYLGIAVIGGLVMLMGIFGLWHEIGTLTISEIPAAAAACENKTILYILGGCMLVGFGAKAGAFPLHVWLPKAHPVAPAPASALLSGVLTKTGIYGTLIVTCGLFLHDQPWGMLLLLIGALTMFIGAMLAVFSVDLKRTLACSSMSQIGFILIGVGMQCMLGEENAMAVHGTMLHMVNHSMIKLVLFMAAGVIFMNVHALDLNVIRGYGRKKPLLKGIFLVGALAISGIPMFGGYISKTLLHESIVEFGGGLLFRGLEYLFLFSGGLTFAYMTKLFVAIFVEKNKDAKIQKKYDEQRNYMNAESTFALTASAGLLLIWGLFPHKIMDRAASLGERFMRLGESGEIVHYFSLSNLSGALISITIGVLVYFLFIRLLLMKKGEYRNVWPAWLDLENLIYRPLVLKVLPCIFGAACRVLDVLLDTVVKIAIPVGSAVARVFDSAVDLSVVGLRRSVFRDSPLPHERLEGTFFTDLWGSVCNVVENIGNHTWRRAHPIHVDYRHIFALRHEMRRESSSVIGRSLSFGLLLAGIGLCLTLLYILWL